MLGLLTHKFRQLTHNSAVLPETPDKINAEYDVVIIGGGGHGLACAHYLAKDFFAENIAVFEKGYLGGGNTARNTAIIRANYITPEGVAFYRESMKLWRSLASELGINLMYSVRGHLTLAHSDGALRTMRWRAEVNKQCGVDSEVIDRETLADICPELSLSSHTRHPIHGALWHPDGATARHDSVAWGYARAAAKRGVEIHQQTEVTSITPLDDGRFQITTPRGTCIAKKVVQAVAGYSCRVAEMVGLWLPLRIVPLQALVSVPVKPYLDPIIVSGSLHLYIWQTQRGEFVIGGATDPYPIASTRSTHEFKTHVIDNILELFPQLHTLKAMRQWAGITDVTPDFAPLMGKTSLPNYYIDSGWGTWGFKATPISGKTMAETVATDKTHPLISSFGLDRFTDFALLGERGAAAVGQ